MSNDDHQGMKKIQAWIPIETWDKLNSLGYTSPTNAVTQGFKLLLENPKDTPSDTPENSQEIPILRAKIEFLQMVLDERERVIEEKDKRITDLNRFSYILENREFKLIESHGERREKPTEEIKAEVHESTVKPARKPRKATDKPIFKTTCEECGKVWDARSPNAKTCSDKCRTAFNRKKKSEN